MSSFGRGLAGGAIATLAAAALAGCYEPRLEACHLTCDPMFADSCPDGLTCQSGLCGDPVDGCPTGVIADHAIAAGTAHVCAIVDQGANLYCWGDNTLDQLGQDPATGLGRDSDPVAVVLPSDVPSGDWRSIAAGRDHTCGIYQHGPSSSEIYCWGANNRSQLGGIGLAMAPYLHQQIAPDGGSWVAVGAGDFHTCAVMEVETTTNPPAKEQRLYCWGANDAGELGSMPGQPTAVPKLVEFADAPGPAVRWHSIDGGAQHTCAITAGAGMYCWGDTTRGQFGQAGLDITAVATRVPGNYVEVSAAADHTCGIGLDTKLQCWGDNTGDHLGLSTGLEVVPTPTDVPEQGREPGWTAIDTGVNGSCGLHAGNVYCWGNAGAQDGVGTVTHGQPTPVLPVTGALPGALDGVAVTDISSCVAGEGLAACWGDSQHGELGDGTRTIAWTPVEVSAMDSGGTWSKVVAGVGHTCGILHDIDRDTVECWGRNLTGEVPAAGADNAASPIAVVTNELRKLDVALGNRHTCIAFDELNNTTTVQCYGRDEALGGATASIPVKFPRISADRDFTCVSSNADPGVPYCWGKPSETSAMVSAPTAARFVNLLAGSVSWQAESGCGFDGDTFIAKCFGFESREELGDGPGGTAMDWDTLFTVAGNLLAAKFSHGVGLTRRAVVGAEVQCWGDNRYGQAIPDSGTTMYDVPSTSAVLPSAQGMILDLTTGGRHSCAITNNVGLQCWGAFDHGQRTESATGFGTTVIDSTTGFDPPISPFISVSAGGEHTCAIESGGRLFCWGLNTYGQLGNGVSARASAGPVALP